MQMGFHPEVNFSDINFCGTHFVNQVNDFQPYYAFNPRFMEDLQLGAIILKDYLELLSEKKTRAEYAAKNAKAAQEEAAIKVRSSASLVSGSELISLR
jgi:hypothetical protein